ncbi:dienelactone hydrolase family protein [Sphingobium nicotianae]|uniref:Dienelactone hydrolase family protein n=1 Tax=Sphingobium nicotianae TaxID=2782607 RepID=A0A9X1DDU2_9SPHN|nr:dienelactone hydrolase family protein [Sphingobium nicotianae]MBT2188216.1 dienelactone hydrolase family protein [Sphingobium nicotianae]
MRTNEMRRTFLAASAAALAFATTGVAIAKAPSVTEKDVTIKTPDGEADAVLFTPAGKGAWPAVILWHDLAGLRPAYREMGRKLAAQGYVVLEPNAFYRSARATGAEINMADPEVRKVQMAYRAATTDDGIARDAIAYVAYLDTLKQTATKKKAGTIGYDVGASYAIRTAAALPDRIAAVGSAYGLGIATARPNSPHLIIGKTKATYYIASAKDDDAREPDDKTDLARAITDAKLPGTVEVYPANHGWAIPGGPNYDAAATGRVWGEFLKLLKARLK